MALVRRHGHGSIGCHLFRTPARDNGSLFEDTERWPTACWTNPGDWRGHLGLGHSYFKLDQIRNGLGHYQEVARLAPTEAGPAFLARAELLLGQKDKNARIWFLHAADCFRKKDDSENYEAVCRRLVELGWESSLQELTDKN